MSHKNIFFVLASIVMLSGCASTEAFNKDYEMKNVALVKDTVFDPLFSIKSKSATVTKIDDKEISYSSFSNEISAGKHNLLTKCTYYETSSLVFMNEHPLNVNLIKGHTYKLVSILVADDKKKKVTCMSKLNDITKI